MTATATGFRVEMVPVGDLKPAEYNPRALTAAEARDLRESLTRFGVVDPVIANNAPGRENVVIGGHQRLRIWSEMGNATIPVHYVRISDLARERELNLRLNKNTGHWDIDLLANYDESELTNVGFTDKEIADIFDLDADTEEEIPAEVPFAREMYEENNYVVLSFDNRVDWLRLLTIFPLPTVKRTRTTGFGQQGIGRVVDGTAFLDAVMGGEWRNVVPMEGGDGGE